jgi:hypothetical protein
MTKISCVYWLIKLLYYRKTQRDGSNQSFNYYNSHIFKTALGEGLYYYRFLSSYLAEYFSVETTYIY